MPLDLSITAPGVYIDEVQVPGPIPGVGTSTAAFIGPARRGPITTPTFLTNWTQFTEAFGLPDALGPYFPEAEARVYAPHAVRGFFDNGGAACYFVRVSTAQAASLNLNDEHSIPTLVVTAKQEGVAGNGIKIKVEHVHVAATTATKTGTTLSDASKVGDTEVTVADASVFKPGIAVLLGGGADGTGTDGEVAVIDHITTQKITFNAKLRKPHGVGDQINIANLKGQRLILVDDINKIEPGTYLNISLGDGTPEHGVVQAVDRDNKLITLSRPLTQDFPTMTKTVINIKSQEFKLTVDGTLMGEHISELFDNLSLDSRHSGYFVSAIKSKLVDVTLADPPSPSPPVENLPKEIQDPPWTTPGIDDNLKQIGQPQYDAALLALTRVDDVNILCIPDSAAMSSPQNHDLQQSMIEHCRKMGDRFAILDSFQNATIAGVTNQRTGAGSDRGFAALYYPWVVISNPVASGRLKVPPSGHLAGVYARTDQTRGVHKAPANESVFGALALEQTLADDEQGPLNGQGINVLRSFPGRGVVVWGARTIAPIDNTQWRYVNVRRLMLFIEESIQKGTQFAVFEPNNQELWQKVKRQVTEFLTRVWRDGALFGATADKAFRVRVDEELNPPGLRALGQLVIEVIVFPVTPAEFIVFRIIQQPGGPVVQE